MRALAGKGHARVVYLGSHIFKGLAREAALKLLELTDGGVIAMHDSSLGFRHGPKTIVNERTLVVMFLSNHAYTRRYDLDLLAEIRRDGRSGGLLAIAARDEGIPAGVERIVMPAMADAEDVDLLIPFIAAPQMFAFEASLKRGLAPDNPNVSGTVSRVVQGVRIHPFE
jgi:tagatose-6-phosphate ketose/aldose isomerase